MTTANTFDNTSATDLTITRRWLVAGVAVGLIGLGLALGHGTENLPEAVSTAQARSVETAVAVPSYRVLTVRAASIDDPAAPQEPLAVSY